MVISFHSIFLILFNSQKEEEIERKTNPRKCSQDYSRPSPRALELEAMCFHEEISLDL